MNVEDLKEEIRKNSEERIRGVESAQARIDALIARAGGPVMVCRNVQESDSVKRRDTLMALAELAYKYGGDDTAWIRDLTDTIDRMEAALYNTLNERDQLLCDLQHEVTRAGCDYCKYLKRIDEQAEDRCEDCSVEDNHWTWRGIPEVTDDDASRSD